MTAIATSHSPFEVFAHERAFREDASEQEGEEYGQPAVDRKAGIEVNRVRRSGNGPADRADDEAEQLQCDECPGNRLQPRRVRGDEWIEELKFAPGEDVLPGWGLELDLTTDGYWVIVKDKTDLCGFAFISNELGLIYTAEPIR